MAGNELSRNKPKARGDVVRWPMTKSAAEMVIPRYCFSTGGNDGVKEFKHGKEVRVA